MRLRELAGRRERITVEEVRELIKLMTAFFRSFLETAGFDPDSIRKITTKFRDAGRRSPPWRPTSGRVPGRPQDGADGNRRLRWLFKGDHKFHADEVTATLVEVRYYLQALSMEGAPELPEDSIEQEFEWLAGHRVSPGQYRDPIQLIPIQLPAILDDPRSIQSGHLFPLDRGGRHEPKNAFLMLARSNQLQGNQRIDELLDLMSDIVRRHQEARELGVAPEQGL